MPAHILVEAAEQPVAAVQQRDVAAEAVEDPGELHCDIAGADDEDALGKRLEVENLVRRDAEFAARDRRFENRVRAYGNEDAAGANGLRSRMRIVRASSITARLSTISTPPSPDLSDKRPRGA